jgi:hypothetical protein
MAEEIDDGFVIEERVDKQHDMGISMQLMDIMRRLHSQSILEKGEDEILREASHRLQNYSNISTSAIPATRGEEELSPHRHQVEALTQAVRFYNNVSHVLNVRSMFNGIDLRTTLPEEWHKPVSKNIDELKEETWHLKALIGEIITMQYVQEGQPYNVQALPKELRDSTIELLKRRRLIPGD